MINKKAPPSVLIRILGKMVDPRVRYDALGEYEEMYYSITERSGYASALAWYLCQIIIMLPELLKNFLFRSFGMLKNYFKTLHRYLRRQKIYTILNISGLAFGLACCILIFKYIQYEFNYESQHEHADRIYKVVTRVHGDAFMGSNRYAITPAPLAPALMAEFPEVESATRLYKSSNVFLKYEKRFFLEDNWLYADKHIFEIFTIPLVKGNPETALKNPFSVVISEEMAKKYFGREDPIGKFLKFNSTYDFAVTGVMEDMPVNTHIRSDFIANFETLNDLLFKLDHWGRRAFHTYFLLRDGNSADRLLKKYPVLLESKLKNSKWWKKEEADRFYNQRLTDIHLKADTINNLVPVSDTKYIYIFSVIAIFILLTACVNYMNLATARSAGRAKEIGVRKVIGAKKVQIVLQFFGESVLMSMFSLLLGYFLASFFLPVFNSLINRELSLNIAENINFTAALLLLGVAVGIISGSYPAFYISSFKTAAALKGSIKKNRKGMSLRNFLVVGQFSISIFLIIGTMVITNQLNYIRNKKLGFSKDHIITAGIIDKSILNKREAFKEELLKQAGISQVTFSSVLPMRFNNQIYMNYEGKPKNDKNGFLTYFAVVDYDYFKTFDMEIKNGRDFSKEIDSDSPAYIINETAAKQLGWENPIGKMYGYRGNMGPVVGVVNDFHYADFHIALESVSFQLLPNDGRLLSIKFNSDNIQGVITGINKVWKSFSSGYPFNYEFMDEKYDNMYRSEIRLGKAFRYFSALAVIICCLGLYGLASFTVEQSTKEIGIRKVLGASETGIVRMLAWKFTKWVLIANIFAWPAAYFFMNKWLNDFVYRIGLSWNIFLYAGSIALLIALVTIIFQSVKASLTNPVITLKCE